MVGIDRAVVVLDAVDAHHRRRTGDPALAANLAVDLAALIDDAIAVLATVDARAPIMRRSYLPVLLTPDGRTIAVIVDALSSAGGPDAIMHVDSESGCNWYGGGAAGLWAFAAEGLFEDWTDAEKDAAIRTAALADEVSRA